MRRKAQTVAAVDVDAHITSLTGYFRGQIQAILSIELPNQASQPNQLSLYRKTLLVALLDGLAKLRFDRKKDNRQRFTRLIEELGQWPAGDLVSTPFLVDRLEDDGLQGPLLDKAKALVAATKRGPGGKVAVEDVDRHLDEWRPLAQRKGEEKALTDLQHRLLLYRYRNYLVHEAREPGSSMESFADGQGTACYHSYLNDRRWHLVYPLALFEKVATDVVTGLEEHFRAHRVDPYDRVENTARW